MDEKESMGLPEVEPEYFPCPACKQDAEMEFTTFYYEFYKCSHCGYTFTVN